MTARRFLGNLGVQVGEDVLLDASGVAWEDVRKRVSRVSDFNGFFFIVSRYIINLVYIKNYTVFDILHFKAVNNKLGMKNCEKK